MREEIGTASSYEEIDLWREAARKHKLSLWIEIREKFDPPAVSAVVTVYDPDWNDMWYEEVEKIRATGRWPSNEDIRRFDLLKDRVILGIQKMYTQLKAG